MRRNVTRQPVRNRVPFAAVVRRDTYKIRSRKGGGEEKKRNAIALLHIMTRRNGRD